MRGRILCLLLALMPVAAAADESPVGISERRNQGSQALLLRFAELPRAARGAHVHQLARVAAPDVRLGAVRAHYGSAAGPRGLRQRPAYAAPHSLLVFDIAPLSHAFETYPASERMYSLMNHEMIHVVQGDIASDEERRWRRFFLGKVAPQRQNPESLLYSYLTVPRFTAPRWYMEGGAVFMETWMGGGLGRAQGGYDEMVFRAMVRDNAHFYDPLGLVSRGTRVDFQVGANAYLYGTRFFTWLAYMHSPEKVVAWLRRDEGSERYYSDQFQQVFGIPLEQAWQDWIAFEHEFQRRNLAEVRKIPITPHRNLAGERGRLGIAHVLRRGERYPLRRVSLSRRRRVRRRVEHARWQRPAARRHQAGDALPGRVVCLRSDQRNGLLHQR